MRYLVIPAIVLCLITGCASTKQQQARIPIDVQVVQVYKDAWESTIRTVPDFPLRQYKPKVVHAYVPNARVDNKGNLYVTYGLLQMFTKKQIQLILLHENAHVKLNHILKNNAASTAIRVAFDIGNAFLPGVGIGNMLVNPLVTSKYSRTQELEADMDVTEQAKFVSATPQDYADVLDKLAAYAKAAGSKTDSTGLWDDHPSLEARIRALRVMQAHEIGHSK